LWRAGHDIHVVMIGSEGWHSSEFIAELSRRAACEARITWHRSADDAMMHRAIAEATAAIYVSDWEGYGLPAIEALSAGCPLITSTSIPALEQMAEHGQVRLSQVTADTIADAVKFVSEPQTNLRLRKECSILEYSTWLDFQSDIAEWIKRGLREPHGNEL
jgi:glycosyltransferase involved in cell wall biosynthesis